MESDAAFFPDCPEVNLKFGIQVDNLFGFICHLVKENDRSETARSFNIQGFYLARIAKSGFLLTMNYHNQICQYADNQYNYIFGF